MDVYDELKALIKEVLEEESFKDSDGFYYDEIYTDYRDEIPDITVAEILKADDPEISFEEHLEEVYFDERISLEDAMCDKLMENEAIAELVEKNNLSDTDVRDSLFDLWYVKLPYDDFLKQEVCMDIVLDTGDMNYDFTCNILTDAESIEDFDTNSSLLWLCEQQGVSAQELFAAMEKGSAHSDEVLSLNSKIAGFTDKLKEYGLKIPRFNEGVIHSGAYSRYSGLTEDLRQKERMLEKLCVRYAKNDITYEAYLKYHFDRFERLDPMSEEQFNSRKESLLKSLSQDIDGITEAVASLKKQLEDSPDFVAIAGIQSELSKAKRELYEISKTEEYKKAEFINSVLNECYNTYGMAALTFLVKMPLSQAMDVKGVINSERKANNSYYYENRTGQSSIIIDKEVECGLMDSWSGKGSLFEIKLIKDVELPIKAIFRLELDSRNDGYGFMEIYGQDESSYKEAVKKINDARDQGLEDVIKLATEKSNLSKEEGTMEMEEREY